MMVRSVGAVYTIRRSARTMRQIHGVSPCKSLIRAPAASRGILGAIGSDDFGAGSLACMKCV